MLALAGLVGCIIPVIPGPLLSYLALLCAAGCDSLDISSSQLWIWAAVTLVVSVADYLLPAYMAGLFGGTKAGMRGATVGMIVGAIFFNIPGVIVGPFLGAFLGELIHTGGDDAGRALQVGFGAFMAFAVGTGIKLAASGAMLVIICSGLLASLRDLLLDLF